MCWLSTHQPELYEWYITTVANGAHRTFEGKVNATYLCGVIREYKQYVPADEYEKIIGVKFARFLTENE